MERKSSISDLNRIIVEMIETEKKKGVISIGNIFSRILAKYKKYQEKIMKHENVTEDEKREIEEEIEDIKDTIYTYLSREVFNQYPKGLKSLLPEAEKYDENQVYVVLELEGPDGFYNKYYPSIEQSKEEEIENQEEDEIKLEVLNDDSIISKNKIEFKQLIQELISRRQQTIEYIKLLNAIYLETDNFEKILLEKVITDYAEKKSHEFCQNENKKYNIIRKNKEKIISPIENDKKFHFVSNLFDINVFFEFKYEDFLLLFLSLTKFMSGIKCKLEIDEANSIYVKFFCEDMIFKQLAETYKLKLQLKPYANFYNQLSMRVEFNPNNTCEDELNRLFPPSTNNETEQFHNMDTNDQLLFPPYETYTERKGLKFRRYTKNNDKYHNCPLDPELICKIESKNLSTSYNNNNTIDDYDENKQQVCCSEFRSIDKLRLILYTFEDRRLIYLKKYARLKRIILLRNFQGYDINNE